MAMHGGCPACVTLITETSLTNLLISSFDRHTDSGFLKHPNPVHLICMTDVNNL
jgi:hypothetical protein